MSKKKEECLRVLQSKPISDIDKQQLKEVINDFFDKKSLAKDILTLQPIYYDKAGIWWLWDKHKCYWVMTDETDVLNLVSENSDENTINKTSRDEILEALRQEGRKLNPIPMKPTWIQFGKEVIDIMTLEKFEATPLYFALNPIPHTLSNDPNTPTLDKIFKEWVGEDNVLTLYQIIAYSLLPSYPLAKIFCFFGGGSNGKSCFLNLLRGFIGSNNACSTELDLLMTSKFEMSRLYKKLICLIGETDYGELKRTQILKKLTGDDPIGFEFKRKDLIEEYNYAKIIIATNNIPENVDDTDGFHRRWFIIDFPNQFTDKIDILATIPEIEYNNLAFKCSIILKDLLEKRVFHNEKSLDEKRQLYNDRSNPLNKFINEFCDSSDVNGFIYKFEFEKRFNGWCKEHKIRFHSEETIGKKMKQFGFLTDFEYYKNPFTNISKQYRAWRGVSWKSNDWTKILTQSNNTP